MLQKILLINPSFEDFYQTEIRQKPTGLKYIQASLEKAGFQTFLLDCLSKNSKRTIPIPNNFKHLKEFYPANDLSPFKLFTHYRRFGMSQQEIGDLVRKFNPDLIGISINFTPYCETAIETAKLCKQIFPKVPIVAGGHHATTVPESVLKSGFIDYVVLGEGEQRIVELTNLLFSDQLNQLKGIDGIAYKNGNKVIINPAKSFVQNLDEITYPEIKNKMGMILTSRGCPQNCNFCSVAGVMGKKVRFRSIESVIEEMNQCIQNGVKKFDFEDDNLTINQNRAKILFKEIITRFEKHNLRLSAMNGLMADSLDEELVQLMKNAGFEWLNIPLVSGSAEVQKKVNRYQSRQQFLKVVEWAQKHRLKVVVYIILGLPEDTLNQMLDDIIFLAELPVLIGPSIFYPPPGSKTFSNCVKNNLISGKDYSFYRSTAIPVETKNFSRKDLITLFRLVRLLNHLKSNPGLQKNGFAKDTTQKPTSLTLNYKLTQAEISSQLIDELFSNKKLRGLCLNKRVCKAYEYQWIDYSVSQNIVEDFLLQIKNIKIGGIETDET
ncbi:B12-binding domain-containing radical SAM protein [candidate division KSB1 bacterium]|nr:B12-binding domain-containing radical SAM protein [candidate division KSB1 bacterium]